MSSEQKRPNYFMAAKSWVLCKTCTLSMKARMVLLVITNHMWTGPKWEMGLPLIAKEAGTSERSTWAAIAELEGAGFLAIESGSTTGAKRANTYTLLAPFTTARKEDDPRNSCESQKPRPSQKVSARKARPSQKVSTTLATVASTTLLQPSTDTTLAKNGARPRRRTLAEIESDTPPGSPPTDWAKTCEQIWETKRGGETRYVFDLAPAFRKYGADRLAAGWARYLDSFDRSARFVGSPRDFASKAGIWCEAEKTESVAESAFRLLEERGMVLGKGGHA
jgi:hypothetical protein